jgi:NAD(P)-dependent dehydrogenase (short-subunit alcohol dehydrogenase family)
MIVESQQDRVAIVTGAAGGLGSAVAHLLVARGIRLALVDVRGDALKAVAGGMGESDRRVFPLEADLERVSECDRVVAETIKKFGRVDILVNAAAVLRRMPLESVTAESFDEVYHVNCRAPFFLSRAALADMEKRNWGRIINFTSIGVYQGGNNMTSVVYESTKGAVAVLTKMFARHGAPRGVLVNTVCPGAMRTPMLMTETPPEVVQQSLQQIPLGRLAEPIEVARIVAWLASDEASYTTGATFDIVGGRVMR